MKWRKSESRAIWMGASLEVKRGKEARMSVEEDMFVDGRSGGNCA